MTRHQLLLAAIALVCLIYIAAAQTSSYTFECGTVDPHEGSSSWLRWSDPQAWPDGQVPGDGSEVDIACGTAVLLDVSSISLAGLRVHGHLRFLDDPGVGDIHLSSPYIVVTGQLSIGSPDAHFSHKATIELLAVDGRPSYAYNLNGATFDAGYKALQVVGGQLHLHGLRGGSSMPVWTRLATTAKAGDSDIRLVKTMDGLSVSDYWVVGNRIAIAPTNFDHLEAEDRLITDLKVEGDEVVITLDTSLTYTHWGDHAVDIGNGFTMVQAAEIALLDRNILIVGEDEGDVTAGGHVWVFQTSTPQYIEGVEFVALGQQGSLGRYPLHFHLCRDASGTQLLKNSMHHTFQRGYVLHGTYNVLVDGNIAYANIGHCFFLEDGIETGNVFSNNVGILTVAPQFLVRDNETDNQPALFWISNPNNTVINNFAAGSAGFGFWLTTNGSVGGLAAALPEAQGYRPANVVIQKFDNNMAHSCDIGTGNYPSRYVPYYTAYMSNVLSYKCRTHGVRLHKMFNTVLSGVLVSDSQVGISLDSAPGVTLKDSAIAGLTSNDPYGCNAKCAAGDINGGWQYPTCRYPHIFARYRAQDWQYGIFWRPDELGDLFGATHLDNVSFAYFSSPCYLSSYPIYVTTTSGSSNILALWDPRSSVRGLKFQDVTTNIIFGEGAGDVQAHVAIQDFDGSLTGSGGGWLLSNNPNILPSPDSTSIATRALETNTSGSVAGSNLMCCFSSRYACSVCTGAPLCYRNFNVRILDPDAIYKMTLTWANGTKVDTLSGTATARDLVNYQFGDKAIRAFTVNVLANQSYIVGFIGGPFPAQLNISLGDDDPTSVASDYYLQPDVNCGGYVDLLVPAPSSKQWSISGSAWPPACAGSTDVPPISSGFAEGSYCCSSTKTDIARVRLGKELVGINPFGKAPLYNGDIDGTVYLDLVDISTGAISACSGIAYDCLLLLNTSTWLYDDGGVDTTTAASYMRPLFDDTAWSSGKAFFAQGLAPISTNTVLIPTASVAYFRRFVNVSDTACVAGATLGLKSASGAIIYLNGVEIYRDNMPSGTADESTIALSKIYISDYVNTQYNVHVISQPNISAIIVEGENYLAAEVHTHFRGGTSIAFDMWLKLSYSNNCVGGPARNIETCDGLDNNADGFIDVYTNNGSGLTSTCSTRCGEGTTTCLGGEWGVCQLPPPGPATCNGVPPSFSPVTTFHSPGLRQSSAISLLRPIYMALICAPAVIVALIFV